MTETFDGLRSYRGCRHEPIAPKDAQIQGDPALATPLSPGLLGINTGELIGTMTFARKVALKVWEGINPATDGWPAIRHFTASLVLAGFVAAPAVAGPAGLPAFGADPQQTSVSGFSSGAFMAVQLQVAYSDSIIGAGVVAGGPYYCAANNRRFAPICMGQERFVPPNPMLMVNAAKSFASARQIAPLSNLRRSRVYVFSGTHDSVVRPPAVEATVSFF